MFKDFDFSWFLTTPGILTCLGCLLIIISIIIFISSLKSNKKVKSEDIDNINEEIPNSNITNVPLADDFNQINTISVDGITQASNNNISTINTETVNTGLGDMNIMPNVTNQAVTPLDTNFSDVQPVGVTPINVAPEVKPVEVTPIDVAPEVQPVETTPINVAPEVKPVEATPINVAPEVKPVEATPINVAPEVNPVNIPLENTNFIQTNTVGINNIEPKIEPIQPTINSNLEPKPVNLPYGGINPSVLPTETPTNENKVIYGGANPLDGTGIIPTIQPAPTTELKPRDDIESL